MSYGREIIRMSSTQSLRSKVRIWSLNYHEVKEDPRVLKQARVLSERGYNVRVLCDAPSGFPLSETLDGIDITRFDWSAYGDLVAADLEHFDFLGRSKDLIAPMFASLALEAERLRVLETVAEDVATFLEDPRLYKSYYRNAHASDRPGRQKAYRIARRGLFAKALTKNNARKALKMLKLEEHAHESARSVFRDMHQGRALVFAANVMRLNISEVPDVIHAHDIYTLVAGVLLAKRYDCKLIYDAHELETARATNMGPDGSGFVDAFELDCLDHVDAVITVSQSIGDVYSKRFDKRAPAIVMNAPEVALSDTMAEGTPNIRKMAGLPAEIPLVVFTGGIQRGHRGVDKVLEALKYLPGVHLATMGPRHEKNDEWFLSASEQLEVRDRVHMLDSVDAREVVPAISSANVSVIPFQAVSLNHEYAMPNKLFEAAFAQVPLAVSQLTEMKRFVEELEIGRAMDQTDPQDVANAIRDILENPENYRGKPDIEDILKTKYSWTAQAEKLLALYDEILA